MHAKMVDIELISLYIATQYHRKDETSFSHCFCYFSRVQAPMQCESQHGQRSCVFQNPQLASACADPISRKRSSSCLSASCTSLAKMGAVCAFLMETMASMTFSKPLPWQPTIAKDCCCFLKTSGTSCRDAVRRIHGTDRREGQTNCERSMTRTKSPEFWSCFFAMSSRSSRKRVMSLRVMGSDPRDAMSSLAMPLGPFRRWNTIW
mmetsp:Transcript_105015/g.182600  ORF Transcript_105015/g.182600 Transcript_105015/m.182600 type:complete len:206 (+) Transcript_105015:127-744(+)